MQDLPFIDALQKKHNRMVGFFQRAALEEKLNAQQVIIAQDQTQQPIGYCIAQDRYLKREELGVIYQLNVAAGYHRKLIGAMLIKAVFDRAAYGCRLFCLWCAQDIEANYFWESIGFLPLAFRTGSRGKQRTHIFWQKRIREGDVTTPYWFPSQTNGGAIQEDRLVLPIPPGVHWKDVMPTVLPQEVKALPDAQEKSRRSAATRKPRMQEATTMARRLRFESLPQPAKEKAKRLPRPKLKNNPAHVAAARELRDRYLEHINGEQFNSGLVLPQAKYEVSRQIEGPAGVGPKLAPARVKMLAA